MQLRCEFCRESFERESWRVKSNKHVFCSRSCAYSYRAGKRNDNWKGGKSLMPYRRRVYELKTRYKMSTKDYLNMMDSQRGCCAICGGSLITPDSKQNCHVDHDHKTEKVRALLCTHCNRLLGSAKDSISTLNNAIKYLEVHAT